jgi:hypothetical protein
LPEDRLTGAGDGRLIPYFILFAFVATIAMIGELRPGSNHGKLLLLCGLILVCAVGLRIEVGGDWYNYLRIFNFIKVRSLSFAMSATDPGYAFLNWAVGRMGLGIWAVNLICASIFTFGLVSLCRLQPKPLLALLTALPYLVIVVAMGYTRQSAAIGLLMLALSQYLRHATFRMLLSLLVAASFHKSAVIVIPMIALASARHRGTTLLALSFLAVTTYYVFLANSTDILYESYIGRRYASSGAGIRIAMAMVPATLLLLFRNRFGFGREERRLWLVFAIATVIAQIVLLISPSSAAVDRVALYLLPFQIVVLSRLPMAFGSAGRDNSVVAMFLGIYLLAVQLVWFNFGQLSWAWVPYQNYLWTPDYIVRPPPR